MDSATRVAALETTRCKEVHENKSLNVKLADAIRILGAGQHWENYLMTTRASWNNRDVSSYNGAHPFHEHDEEAYLNKVIAWLKIREVTYDESGVPWLSTTCVPEPIGQEVWYTWEITPRDDPPLYSRATGKEHEKCYWEKH